MHTKFDINVFIKLMHFDRLCYYLLQCILLDIHVPDTSNIKKKLLVDTSAGGQLVPEGIIHPVVSDSARDMVY